MIYGQDPNSTLIVPTLYFTYKISGSFNVCTCQNQHMNKKVLLRERKRHTACHIASTRYAVPSPGRRGVPSCAAG